MTENDIADDMVAVAEVMVEAAADRREMTGVAFKLSPDALVERHGDLDAMLRCIANIRYENEITKADAAVTADLRRYLAESVLVEGLDVSACNLADIVRLARGEHLGARARA